MNRTLACTATVLSIVCAVSQVRAGDDQGDQNRHGGQWVATWTAAPMPGDSTFSPPAPALNNQTVRHTVHITVGGRRVRVKLSNVFGQKPMAIGAAHVALQASGASIVPGSDHALTFGGSPSVTLSIGDEMFSDPIDFDLPTRATLAVSLYFAQDTGVPNCHAASTESSYISGPGDFTSVTTMPVAQDGQTVQFGFSAVEVLPRDRTSVIVAIGDSTTVGAGSTRDASHSWPDQLFARLTAGDGRPRFAVANEAIGCNRLLMFECGPSGLDRFDHDVLDVDGVTHVIAFFGVVDLGFPTVFGLPDQEVSAQQIIDGLRQLIARAHRRGLPIFGATITPTGSAIFPNFWTPENETKRQIVNHWIRRSCEFDGVIDFDKAVRDPRNPVQLLAAYSFDGIHMTDAGYQAMANAIDLRLFSRHSFSCG
jgi:lysophospholipase L1-like esterase